MLVQRELVHRYTVGMSHLACCIECDANGFMCMKFVVTYNLNGRMLAITLISSVILINDHQLTPLTLQNA